MGTGQQMGHPKTLIVGSKTWLVLRFPTFQIGSQSFRIYGVWLVVGIPFVHTMSNLLLSEYFPWVPRRGGVAGGHSFAATAPGLSSSWILYAFYLGGSEKIFRVECLSILPHFARGKVFSGASPGEANEGGSHQFQCSNQCLWKSRALARQPGDTPCTRGTSLRSSQHPPGHSNSLIPYGITVKKIIYVYAYMRAVPIICNIYNVTAYECGHIDIFIIHISN